MDILEEKSGDTPLGIYVHWPFCRSICPYCHFNRYLMPEIDWGQWEVAFAKEIAFWSQRTRDKKVVSLFFGGGTPSLMKPALAGTIIELVKNHWQVDPDLEVTLEMNPNDFNTAESFLEAGVNRISMGVQSFRQNTLDLLGRHHKLSHIEQALALLNSLKTRYSFDLICGHEHHKNPQLWQEELAMACPWMGEHLSVYHLSYEPGTPFYHQKHKELSEDILLQIGEITRNTLEKWGLSAYEISNYAKPGGESRHNLVYWRYQDYLGLGPGACGRLQWGEEKIATETPKLPKDWLAAVQEKGTGCIHQEALSREQQVCENLLMSLRLKEGLPIPKLTQRNERLTQSFLNKLDQACGLGLLDQEAFKMHNRLILTYKGQCVLTSVVEMLCSEAVIETSTP